MPDQESNARPDNSSLGVFPNAGPINVMPNSFPNVWQPQSWPFHAPYDTLQPRQHGFFLFHRRLALFLRYLQLLLQLPDEIFLVLFTIVQSREGRNQGFNLLLLEN